MAQKSDFKTVETDLDELEEKIRKHRRKIAKRIIIVVAAVVALFLIVWLWMALRTYKSFDVKNSVEQKDKSAVSFVDFCARIRNPASTPIRPTQRQCVPGANF